MPFGLSYAKLAIYGALAVALLVLFGLWQVARSDAKRWQAVSQTYAAQRDEAIAANTGLSAEIKTITADKAKADAIAADARRLLSQRDEQVTQTITKVEEKIREVAVASDKVCSPALAAALGTVCPGGNGANDHPSASGGKAAP